MRKLFFILCVFSVMISQAQNPIILTQENMPFYPQVFRVMVDLKSEVPLPETGKNQKWNYDNLTAVPASSYGLFPPKSPYFPTATYVDTPGVSGIIYDKTYIYNSYCKVDGSGVSVLGSVIARQEIYLGDLTAGKNDNLIIPEQHCVYSSPLKVIVFPLSMGTAWHNNYRSTLDYILTIESMSLIKASFRRVSYFERTDTVVGWGKVIVPGQSGTGHPYDALMVKRMTVQKDSFYINGIPAPASVLQSFCLSQGKTTLINKYMYWRENAAFPILTVQFGNNNFTTPVCAHYDGNTDSPKGITEQEITAGMTVYPNPSEGRFTIEFTEMKTGFANISLFDMLGKEVYKENRNLESSSHTIDMQLSNLPKGEYFLVVKTNSNKFLNKVVIW